MWQFWVDRGGTFTDIVARQPDGGLVTHKLLSENPEQYRDAAVQGIRNILGLEKGVPIPPGLIECIKMGTTVATNALLERKGDRTLLLITEGFADLLRIGYQNRPKLFDLNIVLPDLLYERVEEVNERLDAQGNILSPLDEAAVRASLQSGFDSGIRSLAIALMHGYRNPVHEARIAGIATEIGYSQISTSHETSPLMKLISRADTTVVDSYLSPVLKRYVKQVSDELGAEKGGCERLMFMQSNGGLTDAKLFHGRDAILSGPAGGVVGMVQTAAMADLDKLIGFDMGGTSTDVCHYNGEYERSFETEVAGVRLRAPMMSIHTVAAGGGSILSFENGRFQVGPESAGADPGPACYRRGGPLTVTDCNVLLGKIQPDDFPHVFGPKADQPLDPEIVRKQFLELAGEIQIQSRADTLLTPEEIAEGFLRIAVENMANAIKKISVQRGYDVTGYTLNCFGGAGGQHACLVADTLGMKKVLLHPFAGVLSAYGMGLADIRAIRERQVEKTLSPNTLTDIELLFSELGKEVCQEVIDQNIEGSKLLIERKVHVRYEDSHQSLIVNYGSFSEIKAQFENQHRTRYGFVAENRSLLIESLSVEAIGQTEKASESASLTGSLAPVHPQKDISVYCQGKGWKNTPLYSRDLLPPGQKINGPAVIIESTGTNVVEDGWQAEVNDFGHLILSRITELDKQQEVGLDADPIMLEVFNNLFMSIAEQMGVTLANTAYSVNIKERLDFSCALFGPDGELVANAPHVPVHLGSMGESVKVIIANNQGRMNPGDVFMLNDPFNGGTHLPDVTVITPVFDKTGQDILFYVGSRGHHADIGGRTPGSTPPDSKHIEEEGILITNIKLVDQGRLREAETCALLASGPYPCRNIDQNMADLVAQIAANETGAQEVRKMVEHFGQDVVQAYMQHVQDNAEESVRRVLGKLNSGRFTYQMDSGAEIRVDISIDHTLREAVIDFTGTSDQDAGNYNSPLAICKAAVLYVFRTLVDDDIPLNAGCMKPLRIIAPEGSMINPRYPAAVIAGNTEVSQSITDSLYGALGVIAGSQGTMNNFVWGNDVYQNYETICGGTGAGPDFDGTSAVHSHMTNTRMTDPEVLEWRFPVLVKGFSIRKGSGGQGLQKGGDGIIRKLKFLEPMTVTVLSSHRETSPFGVAGGSPGACGRNAVLRNSGTLEELRGNDERNLAEGDIFIMETPGGGGFGQAAE
ncbi:hydantoinase B/oxoprolinase family protein [Kiloniella laminariae]|uniref:Hydantoinase B/oxoprolinase family protein n=1 Tax=Kiloniella laminariae TaxID=454162 RepID=A0ABT4LNA8_9PROT|nr:hydantoinase B/oxoprolinase family protein [Kiloniella laminariae]MCZ4282589.1 hydantoinase B/oxoprolinase family protein [Kiloniella laminariae]